MFFQFCSIYKHWDEMIQDLMREPILSLIDARKKEEDIFRRALTK